MSRVDESVSTKLLVESKFLVLLVVFQDLFIGLLGIDTRHRDVS